jgi:hypothetical protein
MNNMTTVLIFRFNISSDKIDGDTSQKLNKTEFLARLVFVNYRVYNTFKSWNCLAFKYSRSGCLFNCSLRSTGLGVVMLVRLCTLVPLMHCFSNCGPRTTSGPRVLPLWSS